MSTFSSNFNNYVIFLHSKPPELFTVNNLGGFFYAALSLSQSSFIVHIYYIYCILFTVNMIEWRYFCSLWTTRAIFCDKFAV